jgi:hypothetical protein
MKERAATIDFLDISIYSKYMVFFNIRILLNVHEQIDTY